MKKIAIYGQSYSLTTDKEVQILLTVLEEQKVAIFFEKQFYALLNQNNSLPKTYATFESFDDLNSSVRCFIHYWWRRNYFKSSNLCKRFGHSHFRNQCRKIRFFGNNQKRGHS